MATKCYMVILQGPGDTIISYINKDTWDWINNEKVAPPKAQVDGRIAPDTGVEDMTKEEAIEELSRWEGSSPDNDRALVLSPDYGERFLDHKDAMKYARDNDLEVVDSFEGFVY